MKNIFAILLLAVVMISCSEEHSRKSWSANTDPVVNDLPAGKYWDQYTNIEKKCAEGLEIKFFQVQRQVARANYRDSYLITLSVVLNRDHTYRAHYLEESENVGDDLQNSITGSWSINANGDIVLADLGKLTPEQYGKFRLVFDKKSGVRATVDPLQLKVGTQKCSRD